MVRVDIAKFAKLLYESFETEFNGDWAELPEHVQANWIEEAKQLAIKLREREIIMDIIEFPNDVELDEQGYPTDDWITDLRYANDAEQMASWLIETFPRLVELIGYGSCIVHEPEQDDFGHTIRRIEYSTGGWSGQEAFISALENGLIGIFYLWSWRRGGHYEFRINEQE